MSPVATVLIRDADALAALEPEWWTLWRLSATATPFQSPAWLIPWWRHFHPGELFTVAARREGRLVGLAPFYLETGPLGRRLLPVGISLSDYHDVLLDPACGREAGAALIAAMAREGRRWDAWEWEDLPPGSAALSLPVPEGCDEVLERQQTACPVLALPEGLPNLLSALPSTKRRKLNLARNRATRRGGVSIERADQKNAAPFLDTLLHLHGARWASRGEEGLAADERVPRFRREAAPGLLAAGLLRLYVLRIGGEVAAAYEGFVHRGRAYAYFTGFDPAFAFESPGAILFAHAWQEALDEGVREIHFLRGREPYKYDWGAVDRWNSKRTFRHRTAETAGMAVGAAAR